MSRSMTRHLLLAAAMAVAVLAPVGVLRADIDGEVKAGAYSDAESAFVGGGFLIGLDQESRWYFNPTLEFVPVDSGDVTAVNLDFHYDLPTSGPAVWVGAGPALIHRDRDEAFVDESDDTDLGVDFLMGVGGRRGPVRPFGQAKVVVADNTEFVIGGGVRW